MVVANHNVRANKVVGFTKFTCAVIKTKQCEIADSFTNT